MVDLFRLRLLGPVQIERDGEPLRGIKSLKALALLGYLALRDYPASRSHLAYLFWADMPEDRARANLSWALSYLARLLPGCLQVERHTVQFNRSDRFWVDTDAFDELMARGDVAALSEAVELYRGDLLEGLAPQGCQEFEIWLVGEQERWRQRVVQALETLVTYHADRGEYPPAIQFAMRLLALEPWREEAHRQVMLLLARTGQRSAALAQYETCRRILREELDAAPAPATTRLYERLRAVEAMPPSNLPPQPTPFIGREAERAEIARLLANPSCRLLTLIGPGGIGKTRLALQVASEQSNAFLHGVYFVPLGGIRSAGLLLLAIADAIQFAFYQRQDLKAQLLDYLRDKEILLVLDSLEHLLPCAPGRGAEPGGVTLLAEILEAVPEVKILATSRERLNLRWEWLFEVEGLPYPDFRFEIADFRLKDQADTTGNLQSAILNLKFPAVQLFVERARRVQPHFPFAAEAPAVVRVCQLVEGMPLGIEMAAAWVRQQPCAEIAREIEHGFSFLAAAQHDVPARHRTMRTVFDHSWQRLSEEERQVFGRLSVFRGGFDAKAAEAVLSAEWQVLSDGTRITHHVSRITHHASRHPSLVTLSALVDKSLVRREVTGRYTMHELVRQYAEEKLAEWPGAGEQARDRHCAYFAEFLRQREGDLKSARQIQALREIGAEIDNVRAAWRWGVAQAKVAEIGKALVSLSFFYKTQRWFEEADEAFNRALECLPGATADGEILGRLLAHSGLTALELGRVAQGEEKLRASLALFREQGCLQDIPFALLHLGEAIQDQNQDRDAARRYFEESLTVARQIGDRFAAAEALLYLAVFLRLSASAQTREYQQAREMLQASLALCREMGEQLLMGQVMNNLGTAAFYLKEYAEAERIYREALELRTKIGHRLGVGSCLANLGELAYVLGERQRSKQYLTQALRIIANVKKINTTLDVLAWLIRHLADEGKMERAVELFNFVVQHPRILPDTREMALPLLAELEAQLPPEAIAAARERGRKRTIEDVVAELLHTSPVLPAMEDQV